MFQVLFLSAYLWPFHNAALLQCMSVTDNQFTTNSPLLLAHYWVTRYGVVTGLYLSQSDAENICRTLGVVTVGRKLREGGGHSPRSVCKHLSFLLSNTLFSSSIKSSRRPARPLPIHTAALKRDNDFVSYVKKYCANPFNRIMCINYLPLQVLLQSINELLQDFFVFSPRVLNLCGASCRPIK